MRMQYGNITYVSTLATAPSFMSDPEQRMLLRFNHVIVARARLPRIE